MSATPAELAAIHREILLNPADDAVRLVYADALEDHGRREGEGR